MKQKSKLSKFNAFLCVVFVVVLVANILVIKLKPVPTVEVEGDGAVAEDVAVIDEFAPNTYGGVEFKSVEDVINYYAESFNYTKTLMADYTENGEAKTYYKMVGEETLDISNLLVEGKSNDIINKLVPGIVGSLFSGGVNGLSPSGNRNPDLDQRGDNGEFDCTKLQFTADDTLAANVKDNGDGTITITIQPKRAILAMPGQDPQGRFFNVLGDISSVVESIDALSFSQGTIDENFVVDYKGGTGTITIDTKTKEIIAADYIMLVHIDVQHANVAVLKDKKAALDITYEVKFPASDKYLKDTKGLVRK